jgi:hypothetical protein
MTKKEDEPLPLRQSRDQRAQACPIRRAVHRNSLRLEPARIGRKDSHLARSPLARLVDDDPQQPGDERRVAAEVRSVA